jgi:hypothetical protein
LVGAHKEFPAETLITTMAISGSLLKVPVDSSAHYDGEEFFDS